MTDTELSRRGLLAATAAGLAVAACSKNASADKSDSGSGTAGITGIRRSYGDDPNEGFDPTLPYTPRFMTLVRVSSKGAWDITTNHASFSVPASANPPSPEQDAKNRFDLACNIFRKFKGGGALKRFGELAIPGIVKRSNGNDDAVDFADFNFGWQHDIYIWFDSAEVALHRANGLDYLIEMTQFTADGAQTTFNKSFYAKNVSAGVPKDLGGRMILVRNYLRDGSGKPLRDANGKPIGNGDPYPYSMNIFFELVRKNSKNLVVILDPDTGNGTGYDPLIGQ